ncbi:hypothetical protein BGZ83_000130 [Gryganskiella cystojenkinii]|nr:hypothetical protein BGZ83_000130 [Gryganskiella cystojenkinii]
MATYKQRTPYQRQLHSGRDSPEQDSSLFHTHSHSQQQSSNNNSSSNSNSHNLAHHPVEDTVLVLENNTSDQEWTSIRPTAGSSARAKARQHLFYLSQEQQRAQEWSFVLDQHRQRPSIATVSKSTVETALVSADTIDDTNTVPTTTAIATALKTETNLSLSNELNEVPSSGEDMMTSSSAVASPNGRLEYDDTGVVPRLLGRVNSGDHSSHLGSSDLTSDGPDEYEDFSIWSQEDDDDSFSTSTTPSLSRGHNRRQHSSWHSPYSSSPSRRPMHSSGRSPYFSPSAAVSHSSSTGSLSNLVHPSFAQALAGTSGSGSAATTTDVTETKIQNLMPLHDGSGNFFVSRSPGSIFSGRSGGGGGSDLDSEIGAGWESASSSSFISSSSTFRSNLASRDNRRSSDRRRRWSSTAARGTTISPSEFDTVIQNIALLQGHQHHRYHRHSSKGSGDSGAHGQALPNSATSFLRPPLPSSSSSVSPSNLSTSYTRKPAVRSKLQNCSIYESEMEDIEAMVIDIPSKLGWMQVFEQALRAFNSNDTTALELDDSTLMNPIKALARTTTGEDTELAGPSKTLAPPESRDTNKAKMSRYLTRRSSSVSNSSSSTSIATMAAKAGTSPQNLKKLKQQVSASSLDALQQLQKRHRSSCEHQPYVTSRSLDVGSMESLSTQDPMQVAFKPTITVSPYMSRANSTATTTTQNSGHSPSSTSRATMTGNSEQDSNVLVTMLSTLRRFKDHVKSNLMQPEFGEEISQNFSGDLGIEWATGYGSLPSIVLSHQNNSPSSPAIGSSSTTTGDGFGSQGQRRSSHARTVSGSSWGAIGTGSTAAVRRIGSDCGLESLRHDRARAQRQQHRVRPRLVE